MFGNKFGSYEKVECGLCKIKVIDAYTTEVHPVPLQSVDVTASVVHAVAQVQVTQVFINKEEQPIEAVYYFPVDSNGAVTHFEAEIEGRTIKGVAKAHEEAKKEYEKAIEDNRTAFLGEENKPDIFQVRVGFLKPGNQAKITLGYTTEVKNEKGSNSIRFFLPTTVAPRYIPKRCDDEKSEELRKMQFSEDSPAPLSVKVLVSLQGEIKSIESPTHKIVVTNVGEVPEKKTWTKKSVELEGKTTDMDRDFVLLITPSEAHTPKVYMEKLEKSVAAMAHLIPSFKLDEQPAELIFVLDRSGSMQGKSIDLAKKALQLFLHSLPADCYFNIVGFGSSFKFLFPKSVKYDDNSLKTAVTHAKDLEADLGGTEILEPLKAIFSSETIPGYLRQIFALTDGEVGNTDEVIGLTKASAHESRVFALGIGDGASHHLVEGIAQAGGGTCAFVTYEESIDKKVLEQLKDALQPSLTNVRLEWEGVTVNPSGTIQLRAPKAPVNTEKTLMGYGKPKEGVVSPVEAMDASENHSTQNHRYYRQAPEKIPPIFDGSQLVVFGVFENFENVPTAAVITADSPDGPLSVKIDLSHENDVGDTGMIHKLAAIKIVREIELKVAALGFSRYNQTKEEKEAATKQEEVYKSDIVKIAVKEGLSSKYTSFVAVDTADDNQKKENWAMQTRIVSSQLAHGWHGRGAPRVAYCAPMSGNRMAKCKKSKPRGPVHFFKSLLPGRGDSEDRMGRSGGGISVCSFGSAYSPQIAVCPAAPPSVMLASEQDCDESVSLDTVDNGYSSVDGSSAPQTPKDKLHEVIGFQSFDGSFKWDDQLINALELDPATTRENADKNGWNPDAWATALALSFLSEKLAERSDSWELVANKAKKWLSKNFADVSETIVQAASSLFKSA